ncbi:MAG: DUF3857 domain-containing protein [Bacteroidetes bacterium]|nr:DUF3857 domain-containing protein [Bacteroidota bacterium]
MKKIIIAIVCLSIFGISFAQTEKADAEYLNIQKEYTLHEDGNIDFHYSKELKLLSHYAFHRLYGETFIITNTDFQTLKINEAYTIMADGKKVVTPNNAFNEVLPRFANNAPAYNHIREMVVTHTGLEVGAVIHLDYTIHSAKGFYPALMADELLNESSPVKQLEVKVRIPESKNLQFALLNIEGDPTISNENGQKVYTWTFSDMAANSKESHQVSGHLNDPRLLFSSAEDLNSVYHTFVGQLAFQLETNAQMDALAEKVMTENPDQLLAALAFQKIVSNNLDNLNIPLEYTGFICRTPIETWNSNQGTELEKALLLKSLLNKAHIPATPVAIIPDPLFDTQMGNLLNFQKFAVMLELDNDDKVLISSNHTDAQNQLFNMADQSLLKLDPNLKSPALFSIDKESTQILTKGTFNINDSRLSGDLSLELEGVVNPYFSLMKDATAIKSIVKGGISSNDIESFTQVQLSQDISRSLLEIKKEEPFKKLHNYLSFELPYVKGGVYDWHFNVLTADRTSAIEIPENIHEKYVYTLTFSDDLKLVSEPINIEIKNDAGHVHIQFEKSDGKLVITREIEFTGKIINVNMYEGFKEIMDAWNNINYSKLIFK